MCKKEIYEPSSIEVLLFSERDLVHTSSEEIDNTPSIESGRGDYDEWT